MQLNLFCGFWGKRRFRFQSGSLKFRFYAFWTVFRWGFEVRRPPRSYALIYRDLPSRTRRDSFIQRWDNKTDAPQNIKNKKCKTTYHRCFVYITNNILWSMLHLNHQPHPENQHFSRGWRNFCVFITAQRRMNKFSFRTTRSGPLSCFVRILKSRSMMWMN